MIFETMNDIMVVYFEHKMFFATDVFIFLYAENFILSIFQAVCFVKQRYETPPSFIKFFWYLQITTKHVQGENHTLHPLHYKTLETRYFK